MRHLPQLTAVSSIPLNKGLEAKHVIDRRTASRLGVTPQAIDDPLYDAFGQTQLSTCKRRSTSITRCWRWRRNSGKIRRRSMGGLIVSRALILYTTPVVYLYLDCISTI